MSRRYLTRLHEEMGFPPLSGGRSNPYIFFYTAAVILFAAVFFGVSIHSNLPLLLGYVVAINFAAFFICGYDKAISGSGATRVPEAVLWVIALAGGSTGILVGMFLFRHKISKIGFILVLLLILTAQRKLLHDAGIDGTLTDQFQSWRQETFPPQQFRSRGW